LLTSIVYIFTMPPSIWTGDSGEIATAAYVWGIAHPTGFPTYIILAKLFSYLLPWFEFAYRLNIFSALVGAATIGIVFLILQKLKIGLWPSLAAALSLAFGHTFWMHSGSIQVYSLTAFFFSLAILIFLHWLEKQQNKYLYLLAIIAGIGVGTHLTFLLFFPFALIFFVLKFLRGEIARIPVKHIAGCFCAFALSCSLVYSYIPLRAGQSPELNWSNPSTKTAFINYITQRDYSEKIGNRSFESWTTMSQELKRIFFREFTWLGLIIVLLGAAIAFRKNRPFFYAGLAVIFLNILLLGNYGNNDDIIILWRYFLPSYIIMAAFLGFAFDKALQRGRFLLKTRVPFVIILPAIIFSAHIKALDRHYNILIPETSRIIFNILPQGSIFILGGDTLTGATMYEQIALSQRKDITVISQPLFTHPWYKEKKKQEMESKGIQYSGDLTAVIRLNPKYEAYSLPNDMGALNVDYKFFPQGIIYKMYPKNEKLDFLSLASKGQNFWQKQDLAFLKPKRVENEILSNEVVAFYTGGMNNLAAYLTNNKDVPGGIKYFKKSLEIRENKNALYNLAGIYMALGERQAALEYKKRFDALDANKK